MSHLEVIEGLCKVCTELAGIVNSLAGSSGVESLLAGPSALYKEITGDELEGFDGI